MQDFRNVYDAPAEVDEDFEVEMELAMPRERILAYVINQAISSVLMIPLIALFVIGLQAGDDGGMLIAGSGLLFLLFVAYGIYQIVIMSKHGQSIGKKIMKIKVVNEEGENPGFVGTVLVREIAFNFILMLFGLIPFIGNLIGFVVWIAMLVMLFMVERDRRTLQDMLAKTYVVKA